MQSSNARRGRAPRFSRLHIALCVAGLAITAGFAIHSIDSIGNAGQITANRNNRGLADLRELVFRSGGRPPEAELVRIESNFGRSKAAALARFLRGYLHYTAGNYAAAVEALDSQKIGSDCALGDYALFYRAEGRAQLGSSDGAGSDYTELFINHPDSLMARDARLKASDALLRQGKAEEVIANLSDLVMVEDPMAMLITGQAHETRGNNQLAIRFYRKVYFELAASDASESAGMRLSSLGAPIAGNPGSFAESLARANSLFGSRQFAEAADAYNEMVGRFPEAQVSDEVNLKLGISLLNSRQASIATARLSRVTERNPSVHAEALFHIGEALRRSNRIGEYGLTVDRLVFRYPQSRWSEQALYNLAQAFDKSERTAEANDRYRRLIGLYPDGEHAPEASYLLGWRAYQSGRYAESARILQQHLLSHRYPASKYIGESGFWAGKAEERLGNRARALRLYELVADRYRYGYHGHIARQRSVALRSRDPRLKPEEITPGSDLEKIQANVLYVQKVKETHDGSQAGRLSRADDLELIGLTDTAIKELKRALETAPESPALNLRLAQIYSSRGENYQATLILRRAYPDLFSYADSDLPREAWEIFFPLKYWDTIKEEARRYGIDPYLAAGLIRQESVFNPKAISRVGARGLMQLMPSTARQVARVQGEQTVTVGDLYNPILNIKLGMYYLSQSIARFERFEHAAAAYNAGPARAQQWLAQRGSLDLEDWVENIPFSETRGYVQGVLRNAANYRRLYK